MVEEINAQRDLLAAESGELKVVVEPVPVARFLEELRLQVSSKNPEAEERKVELSGVWDGDCSEPIAGFCTAYSSNMLKNGLEATDPGQTVTFSCTEAAIRASSLPSHNCEIMPADVQTPDLSAFLQHQSRSRKRVGTYSIKLLGERYLQRQGRVHQPGRRWNVVYTCNAQKKMTNSYARDYSC